MTEFRENPLPGLINLWQAAPPVMRGIMLMCVSTVLFSAMHVLVRYVAQDVPPLQVAFLRNIFGVIVFLPLLMSTGFGFMRTERLGLHSIRGILNVTAMLMFFTGLAMTPVARVTALAFSAPLFTALLSVIFLGERFRLRRWSALIVGFGGTLIILRPGMIPVDLGSALVVGSALLWGITMIVIKVLARTESSFAITAYMNIFLSLFSLGPALWVWVTPPPQTWVWLIAIGILGTIAQLALSQSLKETEPTAVMPFDFLKLVWAAILGFWVFAEVPDIFTWLGAFVVFGSGFYIAWREHQERKRVPTN